jgi:hypothetical protein
MQSADRQLTRATSNDDMERYRQPQSANAQVYEPAQEDLQYRDIDASLNLRAGNEATQKFADGFQGSSDVLSGAAGRALLFDLDKRFDEQDRLMKFLMKQQNSVDDQLASQRQLSNKLADGEAASVSKLESQMRYQAEQTQIVQQELQLQVRQLGDAMRIQELTKNDLKDKLAASDVKNNELTAFIKSLQSQGDAELNSMRAFLQQKVSEDQSSSQKSNEKNSILFNELVRLGKQSETHQERLQSLASGYEERINVLEQRLLTAEQLSSLAGRKGETNQGILAEVIDKMETKVLQMEQSLDIVRNHADRERENVGRLELVNLKSNEDFKQVVNSVQQDFGTKLELRMTELVNRLMQEQDERLRQVDDIRAHVDLKERMNTQAVKHERDEMRDRYAAMDSVVKSEFQRKDEAILGIQQSLESQMRTVNSWIKQEEVNRSQAETMLRAEIIKSADGVRFDVETFKSQQVQVTEKLSEMIKMEVDSRLQADKESKNLYQGLIKNVMQELASVRDNSEQLAAQL